MLQYITNTESKRSIKEQVEAVLEGGCKWIQLRMKEATDDEMKKVVDEIKPICAEHDALLLLDDRVELCKELQLTGVHLGKEDMLPSKARIELGPLAVIGVTANTIDDVIAVRSLDIDYIGIGPFRTTTTKKNLAPILGVEGIKAICDDMEAKEIEIAKVAVGGITIDDVDALMAAGVNGVAVSGAIANADDPVDMTRRFIARLEKDLDKELTSIE